MSRLGVKQHLREPTSWALFTKWQKRKRTRSGAGVALSFSFILHGIYLRAQASIIRKHSEAESELLRELNRQTHLKSVVPQYVERPPWRADFFPLYLRYWRPKIFLKLAPPATQRYAPPRTWPGWKAFTPLIQTKRPTILHGGFLNAQFMPQNKSVAGRLQALFHAGCYIRPCIYWCR